MWLPCLIIFCCKESGGLNHDDRVLVTRVLVNLEIS
jgi:hypothetical protein